MSGKMDTYNENICVGTLSALQVHENGNEK